MASKKNCKCPEAQKIMLVVVFVVTLVSIHFTAAHASKGAGLMSQTTPASVTTPAISNSKSSQPKPLTLLGQKRGALSGKNDPLLRERQSVFNDVLRQRENSPAQPLPAPANNDKGLLYSLGLDDEAASLKNKAHSLLVQLGFKQNEETHILRRTVNHETRQAILNPDEHLDKANSPLVAEAQQAVSRGRTLSSDANGGSAQSVAAQELYEEMPVEEETFPGGASEEDEGAAQLVASWSKSESKNNDAQEQASPAASTGATGDLTEKTAAAETSEKGSVLAEGSYGLRMPVSTKLRNSLAIDLVAEKSARKLLTEEAKQALLPVTGELSAVFESGKDGIAAIGYDRRGGTSYGKYQIASRVGSMKLFLNFLDDKAPEIAERLRNAGPSNTRSRWGGMPSEWKKIAAEDPKGFELLQDQFILATNYQPAADGIKERANLDVADLSPAIREVLWSTAVQHGPRGASNIFAKAARVAQGKEGVEYDKTLIEEIYRVRKGDFSSSSSRVRRAVHSRLNSEKNLALDMLVDGSA